MKNHLNSYFLREISDHNILALTSKCNCHCVFCSHDNNPPGTEVYCGSHRHKDDILAALAFLDPQKPIIIGESASPVLEGEPFLYPDLFEVLTSLRKQYRRTPIHLTTNGTKLTAENILRLQRLMPIHINLSLNTFTYRRVLMGDKTDVAIKAPELLQKARIPYDGSIVLVPEITGWEDIENTARHLQAHGCLTLRLLMPAYGSKAKEFMVYSWLEKQERALTLIDSLPGITLLEPPLYQNNVPLVYGVLPQSPAATAGVNRGDVVLMVNGVVPRNRFEAWSLLRRATKVDLKYDHNGEEKEAIFSKPKFQGGGLIFENDLDLKRLDDIEKIYRRCGGEPVIFSSLLGAPYLIENLKLYSALSRLPVVAVKNQYFGGNIAAAGLLTMKDFNLTAAGLNFDYGFLPIECLSTQGFDLQGKAERDLQFEGYFV